MAGMLMFLMNYMTMLTVDDYTYSFSFTDLTTRITTPAQVFPSMMAHYKTMNGRLISHGLVQILLLFPPIVFDALNAGMFCLLSYLIYEYIWKLYNERHNSIIFFTILTSLWVFIPVFGQVFLWLDGAVNYLWSLTVLLLYLRPAIMDWPLREKKSFWIIYLPAGFLMGGLSETVSFAAMGMFVILMFYPVLIEHKKIQGWRILPVFTMLPGYVCMVSSPGTHNNKIGTDIRVAVRLMKAINQYASVLKWLLVFWVILAVFIHTAHRPRKYIWHSFVWLVLSTGMNCMHGITKGYPERSMMGVSVFLIIADGILLSSLMDNETMIAADMYPFLNRLLFNTICALVFMEAVISFLPGTYDVYSTWRQMQKNEEYILSEVEKGNRTIELYPVHVTTKYASIYGLKYVDVNSPDNRPNVPMARYYGAERIIGIKQK